MHERQLIGIAWTAERLGSDAFRCPHCHRERGGERVALHRHLTVLGRALVRMGSPERYMTCDGCGHAYRDGASIAPLTVDGDREWVLSEDELALLATVAAMVFSDSVIRVEEKRAAGAVVRRFLGHGPAGGTDELLRHARRRWGDPIPRLTRLRHLVSDPLRIRIVQAAYLVCSADGELHREESRLLDRISDALDLSPRATRRALLEIRREPVT